MKSKIKPLLLILAFFLVALVVVKMKVLSPPLAERLISVKDNTRNMALAELPKLNEKERIDTAASLLAYPPNPDPRGRRLTVYALRKLRSYTPETMVLYARLLADQDPSVREEAANALLEAGEAGLPTLLQLFEAPNAQVRSEAVRITARIGSAAVPKLSELLNKSPEAATAAALVLKRIGRSAADAVPALTRALQVADADVRIEAALALCAIQPSAEAAVPVLAQALGRSEWNPRALEMVRALEKMGTVSKKAAPELAKMLLRSKDSFRDPIAARPVLARALEKIDPRRSELVDLSFDLKQKNPVVRYRAAYTLSEKNPPDVGAVSMLVEALNDTDVHVAARSLVALTRIGLDKTKRLRKIANPRMKSALARGRAAGIEGFAEIAEPALKQAGL